MSATPISPEQTAQILTSASPIPPEIVERVESWIARGTCLVDIDRFGECIAGLISEVPQDDEAMLEQHFQTILTLGSSSVEMAWQLSGYLGLSRPTRLHEHTQAVLNIYGSFLSRNFTDPRDRLLRPTFLLQDIGKAHCVALAPPNEPKKTRNQAFHNDRVARNLLAPLPSTVLLPDEKRVITLLGRQDIGRALYRYTERGFSLQDAVQPVLQQLNSLRAECPGDYKERFDDYLLASYLADAAAHTQRARFVDVASGGVLPDITLQIRYNADGSESLRSLDRIFSEQPEDARLLRLKLPEHTEVMRLLFPDRY